jgi:hypothetical protein
MQGGESGLEERSEGHTCGANFSYNTWFAGGRSVYTQVAEGKITYKVYAVCSREKNIYKWVSNKVNHTHTHTHTHTHIYIY